jgi:hypothetical protein
LHLDDVNVTIVDSQQVASAEAYLLFYQKRTVAVSPSVPNSTSSSSSSSSSASSSVTPPSSLPSTSAQLS